MLHLPFPARSLNPAWAAGLNPGPEAERGFFFFVGTALSRGRVHSGRETLRDAAFHRITNRLIYWPTCGQLYTASHRDGRSKETNRPFFSPSQKDKAVKHKVTQTHKQRERGQLIMNPFR